MRILDWMRGVPRPDTTDHADILADEERAMVRLFQTWSGTSPKEKLSHDYISFVQQAYKSNGIVFAVILSRLSLFSDIRFCWRNRTTYKTFGTNALIRLEDPWTNGTTGELLARMEQDASLAGNCYIYAADIDTLQRLRPDWVTVVSDTFGVSGYIYYPGGPANSDGVFILPDNLAHWSPIPDPEKNFVGMSWLQPIVNEITADTQMTKHKQKFFDNAATPNLLIKVQASLTEDSRNRMQAMLERRYQGAENAYRTMILENGADATVIGKDMQQIGFEGLQAAGENRIAAAGGTPGIIVGLKEGLQAATYSNYAQAMRRFVDLWAYPQWRSACAALNHLVDAPSGCELWFDTSQTQALRQNEKDLAEIGLLKAQTIAMLVRAGYDASAVAAYVDTYSGLSALSHTGEVFFPGGIQTEEDTAGDAVPLKSPDAIVSGNGSSPKALPSGNGKATQNA